MPKVIIRYLDPRFWIALYRGDRLRSVSILQQRRYRCSNSRATVIRKAPIRRPTARAGNGLLDPGSEFRLHRQWFVDSAMDELLETDFAVAAKDRLRYARKRVSLSGPGTAAQTGVVCLVETEVGRPVPL
jgi:hypothetical protein